MSDLCIKCNNYIYNITKWGELASESGASCLRASFSWGELSWGELSLGQVVLFPPRAMFKLLFLNNR